MKKVFDIFEKAAKPPKLLGCSARDKYIFEYAPEIMDQMILARENFNNDKLHEDIERADLDPDKLDRDSSRILVDLLYEYYPEQKLNQLGIGLQKDVEEVIFRNTDFVKKLNSVSSGQYIAVSPEDAVFAKVTPVENEEHLILLSDGLTKALYCLSSLVVYSVKGESSKVVSNTHFDIANFFRRKWHHGAQESIKHINKDITGVYLSELVYILNYSELFLILHEYVHITERDFDDCSDIVKLENEDFEEVRADAIAISLLFSHRTVDKDEIFRIILGISVAISVQKLIVDAEYGDDVLCDTYHSNAIFRMQCIFESIQKYFDASIIKRAEFIVESLLEDLEIISELIFFVREGAK